MCPFEQSIFQLVALIHHHQVLTYKKHDGGMGEVGAIIHKEIQNMLELIGRGLLDNEKVKQLQN